MSDKEVRLAWMESYPLVKLWLGRLSPRMRDNYLWIAYRYFEWVKKKPEF